MQNEWVLKMISSLGFTKMAMSYNRINLDKGIVLIADDNENAMWLEDMFVEKFGAVHVKFGRGKKTHPLNYQCGVKTYDIYDKEEKIVEFLEEDSFLPVVIVGGVVPEFLIGRAYLFRCRASVNDFKRVAAAYIQYQKFVKNDTELVQKIILRKKNADIIQNEERYVKVQRCMEITNDLWKHVNDAIGIKEIEVRKEYDSYMKNAIEAISNMDEFEEGCDVCGAVRNCVIDFVMQGKCLVQNIKHVEKYDLNCILYDEDFYYVPEQLLKIMCRSMLHTVSFLQLKQEMYADGMIECGKGLNSNYTIKKMISLSGERKRFIKIPRTYLLDEESMGLELNMLQKPENEANMDKECVSMEEC